MPHTAVPCWAVPLGPLGATCLPCRICSHRLCGTEGPTCSGTSAHPCRRGHGSSRGRAGAGLELGAPGRARDTPQQPKPRAAGAWQGQVGRGQLCHGGGQVQGSALGTPARSKSTEKHGFTPVEELSLCILITKRVYTFTALFPGFLVPGEEPAPRGRGRGAAGWAAAAGPGSCSRGGKARPEDRPLQGAYAGETWLVETEEVSVLPADVSSSPSGFLPQQRVVIMQLRNWKRGMAGVRLGRPGWLWRQGCLRARQSGLETPCPPYPLPTLPAARPAHCSGLAQMQPQLFHQASAWVTSDGMGLCL